MPNSEEIDLAHRTERAVLLRRLYISLLHVLAARQLAELRNDPEAWVDFLGGEEHWPEFDQIMHPPQC